MSSLSSVRWRKALEVVKPRSAPGSLSICLMVELVAEELGRIFIVCVVKEKLLGGYSTRVWESASQPRLM